MDFGFLQPFVAIYVEAVWGYSPSSVWNNQLLIMQWKEDGKFMLEKQWALVQIFKNLFTGY